jgi:hypothetical protein
MSLFSCACGVLLSVLGLTFLGIAGLSGLAGGFPQSGVLATLFGLVFIALGIASFVYGLGLFKVSVRAWWLSFAAFLVTTIVSAAFLQFGPFFVNLLGVILLLAVRKHFGVMRPKPMGI